MSLTPENSPSKLTIKEEDLEASVADSTSKIPFKLKVKLKSETPSLLTPESSPIKLPDQSDDANFTMEDLGTYK